MPLFVKVLIASLLLFSCGEAPDEAKTRAKIFLNGTIYTGNDANPVVEAVVVEDNRITFAGDEVEARASAGDGAEIVDLKASFMYPGFTDGHAHLLGIGQREMVLKLEGSLSLAEVLSRLKEAVEATPPGQEIYGMGWIETHWPEVRVPNRHDLDSVTTAHAVFLMRSDGHTGIANTRALELLGITRDTPDPAGGMIIREEDGTPNGVLIDAAMEIGSFHFLAALNQQREAAYGKSSDFLGSHGWTTIHNMWHDYDDYALIERLADEGKIKLRVYNSVQGFFTSKGVNPQALDLLQNGPRQNTDGRVVTRAIKLYMDGSLGSRSALLLEPYEGSDASGLLLADKDIYLELMKKALRAGIQINTHAIGDGGNRLLLDWYEEAFAAVPADQRAIAEPRWRDEHTQILNLADIPRFAELGVIPSMQPSHAIGDLHFAPERLGLERLAGAYAWRLLIDAGAIIAGGTDAPVERGDPRVEFYAAVARKDLSGFSAEGWHPELAVSREEALKMFTIWPAYAAFMEDDLGTIEVGKLADFTVFSGDIMTIPEAEILEVEVVMTVVDGKIIYRRD
ncbi:MAG: amidohydrolase [Proteobacteria bacterium]|nr:amidohydrolase [Pseudomonadota bacterium]